MRSAWWCVVLLTACASGTASTADSTVPAGEPVTTVTTEPTEQTVTTATTTDTTDTTDTSTTAAPVTPAVLPEGFATTRAVVTTASGEVCDLCLWLADTAQQRSRGLMFVTDTGPADGMAFSYPRPHTGTFWMKDTVLPLSIAFFAPDGEFLDAFDMEPCTTASCPNYATPHDFLVAVEVPQGDLAEFGLVTGSRLELLDVPCVE